MESVDFNMTQASVNRRRVHERYACSIDALIRMGDEALETRASNISLGGAFFESEESLPLGADVRVELDIPGSELRLEAEATVRWYKPGGFGVQFKSLRAREVWAMNRWFSGLTAETE